MDYQPQKTHIFSRPAAGSRRVRGPRDAGAQRQAGDWGTVAQGHVSRNGVMKKP